MPGGQRIVNFHHRDVKYVQHKEGFECANELSVISCSMSVGRVILWGKPVLLVHAGSSFILQLLIMPGNGINAIMWQEVKRCIWLFPWSDIHAV